MKKYYRFLTVIIMINFYQFSMAQNVGIGTDDPKARLHILDSSVLFSATELYNESQFPPASGIGTRFMWYPGKAALRAGYVGGKNWDKDSIGLFSFAAGNDPKAKGNSSVALGFSRATGSFSTAFGSSTASGDYSVAGGSGAVASGFQSVAFGNSTTQGLLSFAAGQSRAPGINSTAFGISTTNGAYSTATGITIAKSYGSFTAGHYNDTSDITSTQSPGASTDRIFQLGNGTSAARNNALTVLRDGRTGIGTMLPDAYMEISNRICLSAVAYNPNPAKWFCHYPNEIS